tara:strand:+ start:552 stop:1214 length:663 start_codon:yes stop_codon:yes gene_type:complete
MAENKKSFVLYSDLIHTVAKMPNSKAGELFKHILSYVNDENPETEDLIIQLTFEPIKQQLKRDLNKWDGIREKRSLAGKASAKKRKQKATKSTSVKSVQQASTNPTVSVNVNVNDSVINKKEKYTKELFLQGWNTLRLKHLKKPSHLNRLKPYEIEIFKEIEKCYARADIKNGLVGLFKQKEMFNGMESMRTNPSHFLEKFEQYLTAFTDQNSNLYGQNK